MKCLSKGHYELRTQAYAREQKTKLTRCEYDLHGDLCIDRIC